MNLCSLCYLLFNFPLCGLGCLLVRQVKSVEFSSLKGMNRGKCSFAM
jgi:hypothetical protein